MNIRKTIVPISIDSIKEYFQDKTIFFEVDYENSKLAGKVFLTYLSNLDVPSDVYIAKGFDKEKIFSLIDSYMEIKAISDIHFLNTIVAHILLKAKGLDTASIMKNAYLSEELVEEYINTRKEMVDRWTHFIDSTMLYLLYCFEDINKELKLKEQFEPISDPNYVGLNVVNMFKIPNFLGLYFNSDQESKVSFFEHQFDGHMFKGHSLFHYYNVEENTFPTIIQLMFDGKIPLDINELLNSVKG